MPSAEILSRLTAHSLDTSRIFIQGSLPEISDEEIICCLSTLNRGASLYAHVVYMGDYGLYSDLVREVELELAGKRSVQNWKDHKPGVLLGMARVGVHEQIPDNTRCRTCQGQGWRKIGDKQVFCDVCQGSGSKRVSDRQQARIFSEAIEETGKIHERKTGKRYEHVPIHHNTWRRTWRGRYESVVVPILGRWNSKVWDALRGLT